MYKYIDLYILMFLNRFALHFISLFLLLFLTFWRIEARSTLLFCSLSNLAFSILHLSD